MPEGPTMHVGPNGSDSALLVFPEQTSNSQNPVHPPTDSSGLFSGKKRKSPLETAQAASPWYQGCYRPCGSPATVLTVICSSPWYLSINNILPQWSYETDFRKNHLFQRGVWERVLSWIWETLLLSSSGLDSNLSGLRDFTYLWGKGFPRD